MNPLRIHSSLVVDKKKDQAPAKGRLSRAGKWLLTSVVAE